MHERDGEQSAVVCMLLYKRPSPARRSILGVSHGPPKQPICPKPTSSRTMNNTFGGPALDRSGCGQAGLDVSYVRPITPVKAVPDLYSFIAIAASLYNSTGFNGASLL